MTLSDIASLQSQALAEISAAKDAAEIENLRIKYIGRNGSLPALMKNLYIVGGAQNVGILYFSIIASIFSGINLSNSYTKTHVPIASCP